MDVELLPPVETGDSKVRQSDAVARMVALLMDDLLRVPGTRMRFGLNPLIDLIPGIGDGAAAVVSAMTLFVAVRHRVPKIVISRMALNIALAAFVDGLIGFAEVYEGGFPVRGLTPFARGHHAACQENALGGSLLRADLHQRRARRGPVGELLHFFAQCSGSCGGRCGQPSRHEHQFSEQPDAI